MQEVILVNELDECIGQMEKMLAHEEGILHRAFSILIYNSKKEMLLQQRADTKYHSPGLWSNACCSHPSPGENLLDAAKRRLKEELNIECKLIVTGSFIYRYQFKNKLIEHEYDYVLKGIYDQQPILNEKEVKNFKWMQFEKLLMDIELNPDNYTFWFKEILRKNLL